jgi:Raf kinase inhibitor-like YbhB/YbcL family protein
MELRSSAFGDGERVPRRSSCDGGDVSPPLAWNGVPAGAVSLALVVEDSDAVGAPLTHWLAWGLVPAAGGLAEGQPAPREGRNDFGAPGWRGPCPPRGKAHRYVFRLLALDCELELGPSDRRRSFDAAVSDHVLEATELRATYARG